MLVSSQLANKEQVWPRTTRCVKHANAMCANVRQSFSVSAASSWWRRLWRRCSCSFMWVASARSNRRPWRRTTGVRRRASRRRRTVRSRSTRRTARSRCACSTARSSRGSRMPWARRLRIASSWCRASTTTTARRWSARRSCSARTRLCRHTRSRAIFPTHNW